MYFQMYPSGIKIGLVCVPVGLDVDKELLVQYGELINRFLKDEVDIYWQDDILMVKEIDG